MKTLEAVALLEGAVPWSAAATWADLGCGDGVFTQALVELLPKASRICAVDRDPRAIASLRKRLPSLPNLTTLVADFTEPFELPGLEARQLDGILLANSLHYVQDVETVLGRLVGMVAPGGRVVVIEYDRRGANPWVPYPIGIARWNTLAASVGLSTPVITATRPSRFSGDLYVAAADRAKMS